MPEQGPLPLLSLADEDGNAVRVEVSGPHPRWPKALAARIVVESPFVRGSSDLAIWPANLQSLAVFLDQLAAGDDAMWLGNGRGPAIRIRLHGTRDCPDVEVEDEFVSMVTVVVPVALPDDWVGAQREHLAAVLATYRFVSGGG
ncbi:DUF5959 family protein [Winogradskya consettensis]|nr:DUF5959 family protein [Actinoplanes consettensis]